ncbi:MAG: RNA methyltransferase [Tannerellaceae bacterium]|jgi:tRNA G18 (ribose-2'-O)-methylase SpoU|nr:RNA methyltransferase [Tannerellaceae bacterium]
MKKRKVTELNRPTLKEYKKIAKLPVVAILDDIRSLHNVGSIFRTSDAFKISHLYLCGITACPPAPEIHKTALGAEDSVEWTYCKHAEDLIRKLKQLGYTICAVEQAEGSLSPDKMPVEKEKNYALIFGNEVKGVQQTLMDICDICIEIPQHGTKHSLNVSVSAGIILWEFFKKLH